ncbi:MAG TPA: hypothetical protein VFB73_11685 [Chloroflexota bacterium]|nr:hypothetical protein [Chloroflexota bacterium]
MSLRGRLARLERRQPPPSDAARCDRCRGWHVNRLAIVRYVLAVGPDAVRVICACPCCAGLADLWRPATTAVSSRTGA